MMRQFVILAFLLFSAYSINAQELSFEQTMVDLGQIKHKDGNRDFEFRFTNTGTSPLVLLSVDVSCDCTDIEFSKRPIMPGKSSEIKITYKPAKTAGAFYKAVQVYANIPEKRQIVTFKGEIIK